MNCAGGERSNDLTICATGLLACSGSACGDGGPKRNAVGINGKCGGTGFKTGEGREGTFMWACGGLRPSGALAIEFKKVVNEEG